jgi:NADP-dependent 3-hydroxy acid dehydrogenase YdfG
MMGETKMRILFVGASGVIGKIIHEDLRTAHEVVTAALEGADVTLDLSDASAVERSLQGLGPFDAVVSTAGRAHFRHLQEIAPANVEHSVYGLGLTDKLLGQVNFALAARAVLRPGGSITLTSGTTSSEPIIGGSSLSMVNGALESWVIAAATEMPNGIRLNVVSPSLVEGTPARAVAAFPGVEMVPASRVALAYRRCLMSGLNGRVVRC